MRRCATMHWRTILCTVAVILGPGLSCYPGVEDAWTTQVETLIQNKQIVTAEKMVVGKLVGDPKNPDLITLLAEVRFDQRWYKETPQLVDDADAISGPTAKGTTLRGLVAVALSQLDLAEAQFRQAIRLDASYAFAHYYLGRLLPSALPSTTGGRPSGLVRFVLGWFFLR